VEKSTQMLITIVCVCHTKIVFVKEKKGFRLRCAKSCRTFACLQMNIASFGNVQLCVLCFGRTQEQSCCSVLCHFVVLCCIALNINWGQCVLRFPNISGTCGPVTQGGSFHLAALDLILHGSARLLCWGCRVKAEFVQRSRLGPFV